MQFWEDLKNYRPFWRKGDYISSFFSFIVFYCPYLLYSSFYALGLVLAMLSGPVSAGSIKPGTAVCKVSSLTPHYIVSLSETTQDGMCMYIYPMVENNSQTPPLLDWKWLGQGDIRGKMLKKK